MNRMSNLRLLGVRFAADSLADLIAAARSAIQIRDHPFVFACANPHSLVIARTDSEFREALDKASAIVADGIGCQWAAFLSGVSIGPRITGSDFFSSVMAVLDEGGGRAFFLGSSRAVLEKLSIRGRHDFPRVAIGTLAPPYWPWSAEENLYIIHQIRSFNPDVLWVGMTAPKQEKWVAGNVDQLGVPVIGSIGAVFDYYAGVTTRAPPWVCRLGLEWLYRLPREPKRLWKRTIVSAPIFLWHALLERVRR